MSDMASGMAAALIQNMTASMDPTRGIVVDQLREMGVAAKLQNERAKGVILDELYEKLNKLHEQEPKNTSLINSIDRRIKRIEEI